MRVRGYSSRRLVTGHRRQAYTSRMIALGLLLVLVGFAFIAPRGGVTGSTARRNVSMGSVQLFKTPGYQGVQSWKYRLIQVFAGSVIMVGGVVLIAISS